MSATSQPRRKGARGLLAVMGYLRRYPVAVCFAVGLLLTNISIEMSMPRLIGEAVDRFRNWLAGRGGPDPMLCVYWFGGLVATRFCIGLILGRVRNKLVQKALADLRGDIYEALQRHSFSYHDKTGTGESISRSTTDAWRIQDFFYACLFLSIDILAALLATVVLIFRIDLELGAVTLATLAPTGGLIAWFAAKLQPQWRRVHDQHGAMTTVIQENIAGVRVVKAFAREREEVAKFQARRDEFLNTVMDTVNRWAARIPLAQFLFGLSIPLTLWLGGRMVIRNELAIGGLTTVILYLMAIGHRLGMVGQFTNIVQNASAAAERIMEILDEPRAIVGGQKRLPAPAAGRGGLVPVGRVEFQNVSFGYAEGLSALHDISFVIEPGQTVALVGPTGAGKSTLASLIARYRDPSSGTVLVDGVDVRELDLKELRRSVGTAFQEPFLFGASVRENIAFGRPEASMDAIMAAARAAQADEFIQRLQNGYETVIGERGVNLSGGQKQRIALARALLVQPRILILDDTTAAVDSRTEHLIQDALARVAQGRTTFLIAHRLSSIQHADVILVLYQGRLAARGTHRELLAANPFYAQLAARQGH